MANIILPAVNVLNSLSTDAKLLIEQNGEINRYLFSNLNLSNINAETLDGFNSDYFATAQQIVDLNSTISSQSTLISNNTTNISNLTTKVDGLINNKTILYNDPTDEGKGEFSFTVTEATLRQYEYIEISAWSYIQNYGWWYESIYKFRVDDLFNAINSDGWLLMQNGFSAREIWHENNKLYFSDCFLLSDGSSYSDSIVVEKVWGVK